MFFIEVLHHESVLKISYISICIWHAIISKSFYRHFASSKKMKKYIAFIGLLKSKTPKTSCIEKLIFTTSIFLCSHAFCFVAIKIYIQMQKSLNDNMLYPNKARLELSLRSITEKFEYMKYTVMILIEYSNETLNIWLNTINLIKFSRNSSLSYINWVARDASN